MTVVIGSNEDPANTDAVTQALENEETSTTDEPAFDQNDQQSSPENKMDPNSSDEVLQEVELNEDNSFPEEELKKLEEMIYRSRWVVPVLPNGELELLLRSALRLAKQGVDEDNELCKRFIDESLGTSFRKILTDEAVSGWKFEIHNCIYHNCELLIELCVVKLESGSPPLMEMLALVFNPDNKFHQYNASRSRDSVEAIYAKSSDPRNPRGWLVNLINKFGELGGFELWVRRLKEITTVESLSLNLIVSLMKPFGQCCTLLTRDTVTRYLMPFVRKVPIDLWSLTDEQLKKDTKNDSLSLLVKWLRRIALCSAQPRLVFELERFRLKMLHRLLQISSFDGKMNALNEVNKIITNAMLCRPSGYAPRYQDLAETDSDYLNSREIITWIKTQNVLSTVLQDSLHQPQYVEKLEKIIRFMIKEKALRNEDLDAIWESQNGALRHEAIVRNIHDLLAKLAWDFSPEQLEYVFESCFKKSWATASTKTERELLMELIRRLAEDDKDGMMAHKVLKLLWGLAHNQEASNEIVDLALASHLKILNYSCCKDRSGHKQHWLEECVRELRINDKFVIPALKHIRDICMLYQEGSTLPVYGLPSRGTNQGPARSDIISTLQNKHTLVVLVTTNLVDYVEESKKNVNSHPDPSIAREGHRYSHNVNVHDRLRFLRFLLKDGQLWLCAPQATQIWKCLAEQGAYPSDREACFNWFAKLMGDEPDLDPDINKQFFEENILKFDPAQLTDTGIYCFQRFFKMVNIRDGNLVAMKSMTSSQTGIVYVDNSKLIGYDYLWKVVLSAPDSVSAKAAEILRTTTTNLSPKLQDSRMEFHEYFVNTCFDRIRIAYYTWECLQSPERSFEVRKMRRLLRLLTEYVQQCDDDNNHDRMYVPLCRALRGKEILLSVQLCQAAGALNVPTGHANEEIVISSHTNEALYNVKRQLEQKFDRGKLELLYNDEPLNDKLFQCMGEIFCSLKVALKAKPVVNTSTSLPLTSTNVTGPHQSSPASTSSSESESPSPPHISHTSQLLLENHLPGVLISRKESRIQFSLTLCDIPELSDVTWALLQQIPASSDVILQIQHLASGKPGELASHFSSLKFPSETLYSLEVLYSLLLPANNPLTPETLQFQCSCIKSGILHSLVDRLIDSRWMVDGVQMVLLKLYRFLLAILIRKRRSDSPAHEDSVVTTIATRVVDELRKQNYEIPELKTNIIESILNSLVQSPWVVTKNENLSSEDVRICQEALYTLTASLQLLANKESNKSVLQNTEYIFYLLLKCPHVEVRRASEDAFYVIGNQFDAIDFISALYVQLNDEVVKHYDSSAEYFSLLGRLLENLDHHPDANGLFDRELTWLRSVREKQQPAELIQGHLIVAINVCRLLSVKEKQQYKDFVREVLEDFVFPASKTYVALKNPALIKSDANNQNSRNDNVVDNELNRLNTLSASAALNPDSTWTSSVCHTEALRNYALDLVVQLCHRSFENLEEASRILNYMFYSDNNSGLTEWEFMPAIGSRPPDGFVGLKNAGATCYMNSVLQQLYMIKPIRKGLLALADVVKESDLFNGDSDADYNVGVLKQVMIIFGFLEESRQQFYIPTGFWNHFRLWGEPVNVREQHDALEFFNCLVDSIDEALKSLNKPTILSKVLGGTFADQKICKGCPHRYSREESFTTLNIDIRNHSNLLDSLEQYVKGDLLEGPNAYHCEQCSKKVDTVKRLCIKSLPPILAIQLKRFDYDWDRECAIKFNDYFEFPRQLDMEPYTVQGLARREGETIEPEKIDPNDMATVYELSGIVVHSGQASGGHYYSYIKTDGKWYKFDDGEVCESKMDTAEEMKNQCFGGDYMSEMFDHISKRMSCRRQKRWWNAYILFYERVDIAERLKNQLNIGLANDEVKVVKLPQPIQMIVWQLNLQYTHIHDQFTPEFFRFVKNLVAVNSKHVPQQQRSDGGTNDMMTIDGKPYRDLSNLSMQLARRFLFKTYFHTKKSLRGNMSEWLNTLVEYFTNSKEARTWFALTTTAQTIRIYLLESPIEEVRHFFAHFLANLCHCLLKDTPVDSEEPNPQAQRILGEIMMLMHKDVCEYGRHVNQYFLFYWLYAEKGSREKEHLIKNDVPLAFIRLALEEGAIKYQYAELSKMYQTLATLLHCLDVTPFQSPTIKNDSLQANPYARNTLATMPDCIVEYLFHQSTLVKKILEEANAMEEVLTVFKYLCWENYTLSQHVIAELLWSFANVNSYEIRPYVDIFIHILCIKDSLQSIRIDQALDGTRPDHDGLFDIIERAKNNNYYKRSYKCIKCMVELFYRVPEALTTNVETKRKFNMAIEWIRSELDRKHVPNQTWSQGSNETSNCFQLERSASAVDMLNRAGLLLRDSTADAAAATGSSNDDKDDDVVIDRQPTDDRVSRHTQEQQEPDDEQPPTQETNQQQSQPDETQQLEQEIPILKEKAE